LLNFSSLRAPSDSSLVIALSDWLKNFIIRCTVEIIFAKI
jgi:hypothetical protein